MDLRRLVLSSQTPADPDPEMRSRGNLGRKRVECEDPLVLGDRAFEIPFDGFEPEPAEELSFGILSG